MLQTHCDLLIIERWQILGKINAGFKFGQYIEGLLAQGTYLLRQLARQTGQRHLGRCLRLRQDQVGHPLRLGEVDTTV